MSAEAVPLEDVLDRQLAALTTQQLAALRAEAPGSRQAGDRPALERRRPRRPRETFRLMRKLGRGLRQLMSRA